MKVSIHYGGHVGALRIHASVFKLPPVHAAREEVFSLPAVWPAPTQGQDRRHAPQIQARPLVKVDPRQSAVGAIFSALGSGRRA